MTYRPTPKVREETELERKIAKLKLLEEKQRLKLELPHLYSYPHYQWGLDFMKSTNRMKFLVSGNQVGKVQCDESLTLTPDGFIRHGDLKIGDQVIGDDGNPCTITAIPFRGEDEYYEIEFDDGTRVSAGQNHLWRCKGPEERFRKESKRYGQWDVVTTKEIFIRGGYDKENQQPKTRFVIPYVEPVNHDEKDLFDPYALGVLLGDGSLTNNVAITNPELSIKTYFENNYSAVSNWQEAKNCWSIRISKKSDLYSELKQMELIGSYSYNKHIPDVYLYSSVEQRLLLLQGLLDTDGTINNRGDIVEFNTASSRLADGLEQLIFSLGGTCKRTIKASHYFFNRERKDCRDSHRLRIKLKPGMAPFRFAENKLARWKNKSGKIRYSHERVIRKITPVGKKMGQCISVDSPNACYVSGKNYVVTHNSSVLIRHSIDLATDKKKWGKYFSRKPKTFWYVLPDYNKVQEELRDKWIGEFLPKGSEQNSPQYGWEIEKIGQNNVAVKFNSGVRIIFKTWKSDLQAATIDAVFIDEECPPEIFPELVMRLNRYNGMLAIAFTATRNEAFFYQIMERKGFKDEKFPEADKWQVSVEHDCRYYADGTPSPWTQAKVTMMKNSCGSQTEIDRRIHGRFVTEKGTKYASFSRERNIIQPSPMPKDWLYFSGVDIGSGGTNHPAAISIVAAKPDYSYGRLVKFWKGQRNQITTASDVLEIYNGLIKELPSHPIGEFYDHSSREFGVIAERNGYAFQKANKSRDEDMLNVLFKNKMLDLDEGEYLWQLVTELMTLRADEKKQNAKDDGIDSLRYATSKIPWNFEFIKSDSEIEIIKEKKDHKLDPRVQITASQAFGEDQYNYEAEIDEWNDLMEIF